MSETKYELVIVETDGPIEVLPCFDLDNAINSMRALATMPMTVDSLNISELHVQEDGNVIASWYNPTFV